MYLYVCKYVRNIGTCVYTHVHVIGTYTCVIENNILRACAIETRTYSRACYMNMCVHLCLWYRNMYNTPMNIEGICTSTYAYIIETYVNTPLHVKETFTCTCVLMIYEVYFCKCYRSKYVYLQSCLRNIGT